jgi:uncharacterized protein YndB with AHSA1/START domain
MKRGDVEVTREVGAPPDRLWDMVADLPRMPTWSPENERTEWRAGATGPALGARFRGVNRNGSRSWKSVGEITELEPGRRLAFRVRAGPFNISEWAYTFEPTPEGCRVTEAWTDRRSGFMRVLSRRVTGVDDRPTHNRRGMEQTLERLAAGAEGQENASPGDPA